MGAAAIPLAMMATSVAGSMYSANQQSKAANRQAAAAETQARQQAAMARDQARSDALARQAALEATDADRAARANEEEALSEQTPVALNTDQQSSATRRRRVQQTFGTGTGPAPNSVIRT